jgi:CheY-like chemotaxis protein
MKGTSDEVLRGRCVLVVEDDFLIASSLSEALDELGVRVLGPAASAQHALTLLEGEADVDAALLDVNLRGELSYPVADVLCARGVPFVFATGYDTHAIPARFADVPCRQKPFHPIEDIRRLLAPQD